MQTFQITLDHLDLFSYIGGFSGAGGMLAVLGASQARSQNRLQRRVCRFQRSSRGESTCCGSESGTNEPERMRAGLQRLHTSLMDANILHIFSTNRLKRDHEWQTRRRDLKDFAPRPFSAKPANEQSNRLMLVGEWTSVNSCAIPNIERESVALSENSSLLLN